MQYLKNLISKVKTLGVWLKFQGLVNRVLALFGFTMYTKVKLVQNQMLDDLIVSIKKARDSGISSEIVKKEIQSIFDKEKVIIYELDGLIDLVYKGEEYGG